MKTFRPEQSPLEDQIVDSTLPLPNDYYFPDFQVPNSTVRNYVTDIKKPCAHVNGEVHTDGVVTTDNHSYAVVRGVPYEPRTEISLGMTTAWWTSPRGHNRHTVEHFMRLGIPIVSIGAEGSYRAKINSESRRDIDRFSNVSLATSAHNFHEILDYNDELNSEQDYSYQNLILLGESRGGMVGTGIAAFADYHDRNIVYSDLTAPCFPDKLSLSELPEMSAQLLSEPVQLVKLVGSLTLRHLIHYPPTLDLHPQAVAMNIATLPTLLSGQAGELGKHIPKNHNMHITTFHDDIVSNPKRWEEIYADHPNVRIKRIDGAHLTIAHSSTLGYIESRIFSLLTEIDRTSTMDPDKLDFTHVHLDDSDIQQ